MAHKSDLPHISIVVPFYNSRRYIARCLDALISQQYPPGRHEIVMVDNNSTDGSADIVRQHPRIKMALERKQGAYAARNMGVLQARGEIIAFTDSDCTPSPRWLEQIASAMADAKLQILIGSHQFAGRGLLMSMLEAYEDQKKSYTFGSSDGSLYHGHNNNMAVRKQLLDEVGGFVDRRRGADTLLVRRCVDKFGCGAVRHNPDMRVRHLEIDSIRTYYRKCAVYRRSRRDYRHLALVRGLTNAERLQVFAQTVRSHRYSFFQVALLLAMLTLGLAQCTVCSYFPATRDQ
jgi:glycosyltransferase involved in cell wall biosynthesis